MVDMSQDTKEAIYGRLAERARNRMQRNYNAALRDRDLDLSDLRKLAEMEPQGFLPKDSYQVLHWNCPVCGDLPAYQTEPFQTMHYAPTREDQEPAPESEKICFTCWNWAFPRVGLRFTRAF
jgi:hypothetical protein